MADPTTWILRRERSLTRSCYRTYSLLFVPMALLVLIGLPASGRELIWNVDGLSQYYPFFLYEGSWLRGILGSLFSGQGIQVPLWEWCSGFGADVPTTFDVFLDPLNLVSVITPAALSEWVFQLLVVLRLYLAGLAFVFYCRTREEDRLGTVLGALLYALGGSGLTGVSWASGLHALMLFPVVLAGAERILAGKRPWVFVASLTMLAIVSYYFTYMACILLVAYLALRVVMVERPNLTPARFLRWVGAFAGLVVLCLLLAAFALVPAAMAIVGMERVVGQSTVVPLLYKPSYYLQFLGSFLSTVEVGSDTSVGFGGMALLGCLLLFQRKGEQRELKIVLLALTACMLIPAVGSFLNGLNYATNRWAWAYTMCMALVLVRATALLKEGLADEGIWRSQRRALVAGTAAYALLLLIGPCRTEANVAGLAALLGALLCVVLARDVQARRALLVGALALTLAVNGFYFLASEEDGKGKEQVPLAMAYAKLTRNSANSVATMANDPSWWRYDGGQVYSGAGAPLARIRNDSLVLGLQGIDFYNSVYNDRVDAFNTELAIAGDFINFSYNDLQGRSDLMALLGVKYYLYRNDGTDALPFGFDPLDTVVSQSVMNVNYSLVRASTALPLGLAFDRAITRDDFLALTPAQRQQALLQAVVLEDNAEKDRGQAARESGATTVLSSELSFEDQSLPYQIVDCAGVVAEDGRFVATAAGASVTLEFQGTPQADTFVYARGLTYQGLRPSELRPADEVASLPWHYRAQLLMQDLSYEEPVYYQVSCKSDVSAMTGYLTNCVPTFHMYGGKDTWLVNLGYADAPANRVTLTFDQAGAYSYEDLQVVTQTHAMRPQWLQERSASVLADVRQGCNQLTGSVDLDRPQTLLLTVAYSRGWQAFVDGEPAQLRAANTAFMALDLPAGHHEVELRYGTPGLVLGLAISGVGVVVLAVVALALRHRDKVRPARQAATNANDQTSQEAKRG